MTRTLALAGLLATTCLASEARADASPDFSWMAGEWVSCVRGEIVEEHWMGPAKGMLIGSNFTRRTDGSRASYEFLRLVVTPEGASYFATPQGIPTTEFKMIRHEPSKAVFENPAIPYPARILYWREGEKLHARTEGAIKGQAMAEDWVWTRKSASKCLAKSRRK